MKDNTILLVLAAVGVLGWLAYKKGIFSGAAYNDKYTAYAQQLQGLATNATGNFVGVHSAISQGINDQINTSVNTALNSITNWANMAQQNRTANDQREYEQFMGILSTI